MLVRKRPQYQFQGSKVLARVQARNQNRISFPIPDPFSDEQWGYVIETMSQRAIFAAKLLAEMPQNGRSVHGKWSVAISFTLISAANAPAQTKPTCKHIGAIYYQLGDRFSEDPYYFNCGVALKTKSSYANGLLALKLTLTDIQERHNTQYPLKLTLSGNTTAARVSTCCDCATAYW